MLRVRDRVRARVIGPSSADAAFIAANVVLAALHAEAAASAEAQYAAGPGARTRSCRTGEVGERRARKTRSAYLSRFRAAAYGAALETACAEAESELAAARKEAERANTEQEALRWEVMCAENKLLRRRVGYLETARGAKVSEAHGNVVGAGTRLGEAYAALPDDQCEADGDVRCKPALYEAAAGSRIVLQNDSKPGEKVDTGEEAALTALITGKEDQYDLEDAESGQEADDGGEAALSALLLGKEDEYDLENLPDLEVLLPEPVGPNSAA